MRLFPGLVAVIAVAAAAHAAPNVEFAVGLCAAKADAAARLACYDAIAAKLQAGEAVAAPVPAAPPAPVAPPAAPAPVAAAPVAVPAPVAAPAAQPEARFGAETLRKEERASAGQPEEVDSIQGEIAQLAFAQNGRAIFTLSNGQVWRQINGDTTPFRGKQGDKATIERSLFGSYSLTVEGRNLLVKVQRVR
jgi:hypothetical protein